VPELRFGYKLPNCAGVICEPDWARPQTIERLAAHAGATGFDSVWLHDHLLTPAELRHVPAPAFYDPVVLMPWLATIVPGVLIGVATLVIPLREPVGLAKQLATLEALFPGRIVAGVGVGRYESEFVAFGSDRFRKRGRMTDEYLRLMRALLSEPEVTLTGEFRSVAGAIAYPQKLPPLWVGGSAPAALRRAARLGDGWVPAAMTPEDVRAGRARLDEALDAEGRERAAIPVALSLTVERVRTSGATAREDGGLHVHHLVVSGSDAAVAEQLAAYAAAGVSHFLLSFRAASPEHVLEDMTWFTHAIKPQLAQEVRR
jgi:probable F420-dependent oxidoreductase